MAVKTKVRSSGTDLNAKGPVLKTLITMAIAMAVLFVLGTFVDLPLSRALHGDDSLLIILVSTISMLPIIVPLCVFAGALARYSMTSSGSRAVAWVKFVLLAILSAGLGFLLIKLICSDNGIGPLLSGEAPKWVCALIGVPVGLGLAAVGFAVFGKRGDARIARTLLIISCALILSFLCVELFKHVMLRPRYRTLLLGYDGIEYCPWYRRCSNAKALMASYGLEKDAFYSFPSAHALQMASIITSFYGLSLLWPQLREDWHPVIVFACAALAASMYCRIVLGAHFLSDVAFGALIAVLFGIGAQVVDRKLNK